MKKISSTARQNAMIGLLIAKMRLTTDIKEEIIYNYTDGRTTSIRDLYFDEAKRIIQTLNTGVVNLPTPADKMRRKILSMAHELNWELPTGKVDMPRVNAWCYKYGYLHKGFNDYTAAELPTLVTAFEHMYAKHLRDL